MHANWALQVHTLNLAGLLVDDGWDVVLLLVDADEPDGLIDEFQKRSVVTILRCRSAVAPWTNPNRGRSNWITRKLRITCGLVWDFIRFHLCHNLHLDFISEESWSVVKNQLQSQKFDLAFAVEPVSLALLECVPHLATPIVYYSLELYGWRHPMYSPRQSVALRRLHRRGDKYTAGVIIQDPYRGLELSGVMPHSSRNSFYLPVSVRPEIERSPETLRGKYDLTCDHRVILYFGVIRPGRYLEEMVAQAWTFPPEWRLVIHGSTSGDDTFLKNLRLAAPSDRVVFSTHHIDESDLSAFISGADLGVVFYRTSNVNELHTGYASEKAARYAEAGVPFVSFAVPTFAEVFAKFGCGKTVTRIEELTEVASEIFQKQERYAKGARQAFDKVYNFNTHKEKLCNWLRGIIEA